MTRFSLNTLAAGVLLAMTQAALADDPQMAQKPGIPTLAQVMGASGITVAGYLDASYTYLSGAGTFSSGTADRVFDTERNSFNLHMVDLTVSELPSEGFGGFVELGAGSDAKVIHSAGAGDSSNDFDVTQAYLHYATGPWMLTAGKYVTASGAEVIRSPDNMNFSRSILFGYAIPFTHTGLRGYYTVSDALQLFAGLNNGWDVLKESAQASATDGTQATGKTVELGFSSTPVKPLTVAGVYYGGDESSASPTGPNGQVPKTGRRDLYDIVATYTITDALSATVNYDWAKQKDAVAVGSDASWNGLAGYLNYKMNDMWRVALRAETFDDKDGFRTGLAQKWKEATLTLAYMPAKNTELRAEARRDWTNADTSANNGFLETNGNVADAQHSFGLEAIYKF